jgi:hypothetical protein
VKIERGTIGQSCAAEQMPGKLRMHRLASWSGYHSAEIRRRRFN